MKLRQILGRSKELSDFLDGFARKHLTAVLAEIDRPPATAIESFGPGRNTLVRRLVLADGSAVVLRVFPAEPTVQGGFSHWHLNRLLAGRGLRVPAIHFRRTYPFPRGKSDVEVMLEEFIDGRPIVGDLRDDEPVRARLAQTLRVIHGDQAPHPGCPWLNRVDPDPLDAAMQSAPARFARVRAHLSEVKPAEVKTCLTWLRETLARRPRPAAYEFTHGDYGRDNLLLTREGEIALIDLGNVAFGCFEFDLVDAHWSFFDPAWWEGFCDAYFAAEPARRERFALTAPLFFVFYYLRKAASRSVRARKAAAAGKTDLAETCTADARQLWELLLRVMESET